MLLCVLRSRGRAQPGANPGRTAIRGWAAGRTPFRCESHDGTPGTAWKAATDASGGCWPIRTCPAPRVFLIGSVEGTFAPASRRMNVSTATERVIHA